MTLSAEVTDRLRADDSSFVVTGATGWFGRVTVGLLAEALGGTDRIRCYASRDQELTLPGRPVRVRPLEDLRTDDLRTSYLLHYAFVMRDRLECLGLDQYVSENTAITRAVVSAIGATPPLGLFVTSSGAARTAATTPYGWLKAVSDDALRSACRAADVRVLIGRVFAVAGSGNPNPLRYALSSFADQARRGGPIQVTASRAVRRSYTGVADIVALALSDLVLGAQRGTPADNLFETGGEVVEVGELARRVASAAAPGVDVCRPPIDCETEPDDYVGDPAEMLRLMAVHGMVPASLDQLIAATLAAP